MDLGYPSLVMLQVLGWSVIRTKIGLSQYHGFAGLASIQDSEPWYIEINKESSWVGNWKLQWEETQMLTEGRLRFLFLFFKLFHLNKSGKSQLGWG